VLSSDSHDLRVGDLPMTDETLVLDVGISDEPSSVDEEAMIVDTVVTWVA